MYTSDIIQLREDILAAQNGAFTFQDSRCHWTTPIHRRTLWLFLKH